MAKSYKKKPFYSNIWDKGVGQYNPTTGLDETVSKSIANRNIEVSSSKSKEMTEKRIKINSNLSTPKVSEKKSNRNQKILDKLNRTRTRNQGGITSSGGKKNVTPVYRNMGIGVPPGGTNFPNTLNQ